ncbi:MAG: hypothetical protein WCO97_04345 [bacterium]
MDQNQSLPNSPISPNSPIRHSPRSLIKTKRSIFAIITLLIVVGFVTHFVDKRIERKVFGTAPDIHSGPWGDLQTWDVRIEQPMEYVGFEKTSSEGPVWNFGTLSPVAVEGLLLDSGCTAEQSQQLLKCQVQGGNGSAMYRPKEALLLSLSPEVRSKLYLALAHNAANRFQANPYPIPSGDMASFFVRLHDSNETAFATMKKLLYTRNGYTYFSDPERVLKDLPTAEERLDYLQSLTSQSAVMMRLLIRPDSDIDKPLNYWALSMPGVLMKNLTPLFESQRRLPEGGSISILYLLPKLAREKLFSTPLPPASGDGKLPDCHWTALNYFNATYDPRMADNEYASRFITENYYEIAKPGIGGDLLLLLNAQGGVIHSAVYIADDVVFTKNGISYSQPWILMHEKDLVGSYSALESVKVAYFRRRGI